MSIFTYTNDRAIRMANPFIRKVRDGMIDKISMLKDKKWTDKIINNKRHFFCVNRKRLKFGL